ncbi:serine hydrolase [Moheibacter stercoris]|uniref:CubicO group peptidase (Beta-lactamase class C family) n=1 Tax=Moheibacter stercoris TaxID=1628251 RepID=A0ABV2LVZ8_9FLAO
MMNFSTSKRFLVAFVFLVSLSLLAQNALPKDFDQWLENSRNDWKIPGMAVGVVQDGKVIYAQGFGEKQLGKGDKVDENTVFSIASVSKNMTAAALGILVDEGKISWDDKITKHIPWFQFRDPWATKELTIRDALIHRVGLGRILGNRLQFMTKSSRDEVLKQVRYMDFEEPFRSGYVYSNVMYSLAGQVIEYTEGRTWDQFLQERLFQPLGMNRTTTTIAELEKQSNVAFPHQEIDGKIVPIPRRNWDNAGPAGGVNSSISDLNKWMLMQLGTSGSVQDKVIISEKTMNEIHRPQISTASSNPLASQSSYGLGWQIFDYKGKRIWTHSGATDGFNTFMFLVPELNLGIVMAGNAFNSLGTAVAYQVIDHQLNSTDKDWSETILTNYQNQYQRAQEARDAIHNARVKNTQPSLNLNEYVGIYESLAYGKVEVKLVGKDLVMRFWNDEDLEAKLEHWHFDTFRAVWKNRAQREEFMQFHLNKMGKVDALDFEFVLRPMLLQVGAYPSNYTHTEKFEKK